MKQTISRAVSLITYILAILLGTYQLIAYEGGHKRFIGWLFIIYGTASLIFFIMDRRSEAQ